MGSRSGGAQDDAALGHAPLDCVVGADRDRGGVRAQVLGDDDAEQVPRQEAHAPSAGSDLGGGEHRDDQGPIGVAVGGHDGVEGTVALGRRRERLEAVELFVGDVLGVDGNERLAAGGRAHVGAELAKDSRQEVAPHGRVLIDEHAKPRETARREAADEATNVALFGSAIDRRQARRPLDMPAASNAEASAVLPYSAARTRSTSRVIPGSSVFRTSPTLLLILIPLRSNGM